MGPPTTMQWMTKPKSIKSRSTGKSQCSALLCMATDFYSAIAQEPAAILVRDNKLGRVFIGARSVFNDYVKYIAVAGKLPKIVDEEDPLYSAAKTFTETEAGVGGQIRRNSSDVLIEIAPGSPAIAASSNNASAPVAQATVPTNNNTRRAGRNTVARPPNCFIIFRTHLHPLVVRDNPGVHNNVIFLASIISKMWHAAPASIIDQYKALANQAKAQHAALHPNYRYQPRKSSEKKRPTSDAFAPRDDFEVVITANYPNEIVVNPAVADANKVNAFDDLTGQGGFHDVFETINGDDGPPNGFQDWAVWSNEAYTFGPLPYDHDLNDLFFGNE
ncbi:hypothetical protein D6D27_10039 [Aureobasidium pullulans]|nr:hypothetical protein D6D27_10039 [Aureobasidium pullulans]